MARQTGLKKTALRQPTCLWAENMKKTKKKAEPLLAAEKENDIPDKLMTSVDSRFEQTAHWSTIDFLLHSLSSFRDAAWLCVSIISMPWDESISCKICHRQAAANCLGSHFGYRLKVLNACCDSKRSHSTCRTWMTNCLLLQPQPLVHGL